MKPIYLEKSLGIDLREESVALVFLGKQFRAIDVLGTRFFETEPLRDDNPDAERKFLDEINRFMMNNNASPDHVLLSLPRGYFTLKTFDLPAPNRKAVNSMIEFELERHCAAEPENLYYDFQAVEKSENNFRVVLAAIKKEIADYYINLTQRINLKPSSVSLSSLANIGAIAGKDGLAESVAILVDFNSGSLETSVAKDGVLESSRYIPLPTQESREANSLNEPSKSRVENLAEKLSHTLVDEIQSCLASCDQIDENDPVEAIYLFGGGHTAIPLAKRLEGQVHVSCIPVELGDETTVPGEAPFAFFNTAYGLALEGLEGQGANILPPALKPKKRTFNIKTTLGLAAGVVLLSCGLLVAKILQNQITLDSLDAQFNEIKEQVGELEKIDLEFDHLKQYIEIFDAIDQKVPLKLPVIRELSQIIPVDTWLTDISIVKNKIEIKGFSSSASKLVPLIESSPFFQDTAVNGTIVSQTEGEKFAIRSTLVRRES